MHPHVYNSIIYNSQDMEAAQVSLDRWMDKEDNGILFSHKKEWNLAICKDVDGATDYNVKQNKSARERQIPYDSNHMWNLRNKTKREKRDKPRNRLLTIENKVMVTIQGVGAEWVK